MIVLCMDYRMICGCQHFHCLTFVRAVGGAAAVLYSIVQCSHSSSLRSLKVWGVHGGAAGVAWGSSGGR